MDQNTDIENTDIEVCFDTGGTDQCRDDHHHHTMMSRGANPDPNTDFQTQNYTGNDKSLHLSNGLA